MKNFTTQCVTLMMIIVVVYTAPTSEPCKELRRQLNQIKEARNELEDMSFKLSVYKVSGTNQICVEDFFCLANKSLAIVTHNNSDEKLNALQRALNVYSKNETCELDKTKKYSFQRFLDDINKCVNYALKHLNVICHK